MQQHYIQTLCTMLSWIIKIASWVIPIIFMYAIFGNYFWIFVILFIAAIIALCYITDFFENRQKRKAEKQDAERIMTKFMGEPCIIVKSLRNKKKLCTFHIYRYGEKEACCMTYVLPYLTEFRQNIIVFIPQDRNGHIPQSYEEATGIKWVPLSGDKYPTPNGLPDF